MTFAFAGQIFPFFARPGNVDISGFNFTLSTPKPMEGEKDTSENLGLVKSLLGQSCFGPKYTSGQSIIWAEVFLGPKCASGRSMHGAKVSVGPKCYWAQTGCEPVK